MIVITLRPARFYDSIIISFSVLLQFHFQMIDLDIVQLELEWGVLQCGNIKLEHKSHLSQQYFHNSRQLMHSLNQNITIVLSALQLFDERQIINWLMLQVFLVLNSCNAELENRYLLTKSPVFVHDYTLTSLCWSHRIHLM